MLAAEIWRCTQSHELPVMSQQQSLGGLGQKGLGLMAEEKRGAFLSTKLEALIDSYGIKELLSTLVSICWGRVAKATEEGQNPSQWSELAVKLGTAIEG